MQQALNDHEAITYRPKDNDGRCRHEFPAMVEQLFKCLRRAAASQQAEDNTEEATQEEAYC